SRLLRLLLGHDVTVLVAHHAEEEDGIERLERDLDGVRVYDLDGLDDLEVDAVARPRSLVDLPLEAELDVLGGHLTVAFVELHALPELEGPHRAVGRERPTLGQVRLRLCRRDLAILDGEAGESTEHETRDGLGLSERARVRIERVGLLGRDVQDLALGLGERGARRGVPDKRGQQACEGDERRRDVPSVTRHGYSPYLSGARNGSLESCANGKWPRRSRFPGVTGCSSGGERCRHHGWYGSGDRGLDHGVRGPPAATSGERSAPERASPRRFRRPSGWEKIVVEGAPPHKGTNSMETELNQR